MTALATDRQPSVTGRYQSRHAQAGAGTEHGERRAFDSSVAAQLIAVGRAQGRQ